MGAQTKRVAVRDAEEGWSQEAELITPMSKRMQGVRRGRKDEFTVLLA